jgi:hypothetical protein
MNTTSKDGRSLEMFAIVRKDGHRLGPALDDDGTRSFLVWPTLDEAIRGFEFQMNNYLDDELEAWKIVPVSQLPPLV